MSSAAGKKETKRKRRRACAECFRLREKCVYGDAADGEPCQRCSKLGKRCEPRNPESAARRKAEKEAGALKRDKPNACAECYRTRNKCVQTSSGSCERCTSVGKVCMPRIVVRRTPAGQAEFEDELSRVASSMSELCVCEGTTADLMRTRKAAADMPVLISELRLKAVPPATLGMLRYMMFMAQVDGSLERLHKTTAMAAAMGASEVIDALDTNVPPLPQAHVDYLTSHAIEYFKLEDTMTGAFYLTGNVGKRAMHSNPLYNLFCTQAMLEEQVQAGKSPVLESWRPCVVDKVAVRKIVEKSNIQALTAAKSVTTEYGPVIMVGSEETVVEAVDLSGGHFQITLNLNFSVQEDGKFFFGAVRMRNVKPIDARASYRYWELLADATDTESVTKAHPNREPTTVVDQEEEEELASALDIPESVADILSSACMEEDVEAISLPSNLDSVFATSANESAPLPGSVMADSAPGAPLRDPVMIPMADESLAPPSLPPEQQDAADQLLQDLFSSP